MSNAKKMQRAAMWFATNGGMAAVAWFAVNGSEGAGRLLVFASWLMVLLYAGALCAKSEGDDRAKEIIERGRPVPEWLSSGYDTALALFLVWHGWWFTAAAVVIQAAQECSLYRASKKEESK